MNTFFEFDCAAFSPTPAELDPEQEGYINEGMYARMLSDFLVAALPERGLQVKFVAVEDWGHWIELDLDEPVTFAICCGDQGYGHLVFTDPSTLIVRKLFRKIDVSEQLAKISDAIMDILQGHPDVRNLRCREDR